MQKTYSMTIAGCKRELALCPVSDTLDIAAFIMFGDVELTEKAAEALLKKCPPHDVIVTAEAKGIPLAYEMARQGCRKYFVARKGLKLYMRHPLEVEVKSITTEKLQHLYLSEDECRFLVQNLIWFQSKLRQEGRYTDAVDDLIIKLSKAKPKKIRVT